MNTELGDFNDYEYRQKVIETLLVDVDDYCDQSMNDGPRKHLGASSVGQKCARQSFYAFRWVCPEVVNKGCSHQPGQMRRLHRRGHNEEPLMWDRLRGAGWTIWDTNPETGKQYLFADHDGHFGGSCDALAILPEKFGFAEPMVIDLKTSNSTQFARLKKDGIKLHKPTHDAQLSVYGVKFGVKWACYIVVNKNNDELYMEIFPIDVPLAEMQVRKAYDIINAEPENPPAKIALRATDFNCKFCSFVDICHYNEPVHKNCRSCKHSRPVADAKWHCLKYNCELTDDLIKTGCDTHEGL